MVCRWFRADEPGFQSAILSKKMLENQPLAERFQVPPEEQNGAQERRKFGPLNLLISCHADPKLLK